MGWQSDERRAMVIRLREVAGRHGVPRCADNAGRVKVEAMVAALRSVDMTPEDCQTLGEAEGARISK